MLALAIIIGGIYVLIKGEVALTANMVVRGWKARVIGVVLLAYLPMAFCLGFALALYANANNMDISEFPVFLIDIGCIAVACMLAGLLGFIWGKPAAQWDREAREAAEGYSPYGSTANPYADANQYPPPPPSDNPYQSPHNR